MSEFGGMSIQERIRAMNKTIDKVGALPPTANTTTTATATASATLNSIPSTTSDPEEGENEPEKPPAPRLRASVVDMWRSREATSSKAPPDSKQQSQQHHQPQQSSLPLRKKSVLEKWSSAQQKSVALEKVVGEDAEHEEKTENDDQISPPKRSVAEIIAQKSRITQVATTPQRPVVKPSPQQHPKMSVADLIAQRASTLGSTTASATTPTAHTNATVPAQGSTPKLSVTEMISQRAAILTTITSADDEKAAASVNSRDQAAVLTADTTTPAKQPVDGAAISDSSQPQRIDYPSDNIAPSQSRPSVSDIWKKRASIESDLRLPVTSLTPLPAKDTSTLESEFETPTSSIPEGPSNSTPVSKPSWAKRSTPTGPAKLSSPSPIKNGPDMDSRPVWATAMLKHRESNPGPNAASPSVVRKPAWSTANSPSLPSSDKTNSSDSKPAWARKTLHPVAPIQDAVSTTPAAESTANSPSLPSSDKTNSSDSKPAWAKKTLHPVAPIQDAVSTTPAADSRPAWARKSLNSTSALISPTLPACSPGKPVSSKPSWAKKSLVPIGALNSPSSVNAERTEEPAVPIEAVSGPACAKRFPATNDVRATLESLPSPKRTPAEIDASAESPAVIPSPIAKKPSWTAASLRKTGVVSAIVPNSGKDDRIIDFVPIEQSDLTPLSESSREVEPAIQDDIDTVSAADLVSSIASQSDAPPPQSPSASKIGIAKSDNSDSVIIAQASAEASNEGPVTVLENRREMSDAAIANDAIAERPDSCMTPNSPDASHLARDSSVSAMDEGGKRITAVDWPLSDEPENRSETKPQSGRPNLSIVGPISPPRPLGVRSPSATDFWNKLEKQAEEVAPKEPASNEPISTEEVAKRQPGSRASKTPLMELAMRYKFSPARSKTTKPTSMSKQPVSKSSVTQKRRISPAGSQQTDVHRVVSGEGREVGSPNPPSFASRRRNRVAQKYLSSKAVVATASSDLESVATSKTTTNSSPASRSTPGYGNAANASYPQDKSLRITSAPDASPMRSSSSRHASSMSPKSSKLSRPEEKKEIQKIRNRMKGREDDWSGVSEDTQSTFSQDSSKGIREDVLKGLRKDRAIRNRVKVMQTSVAGTAPERYKSHTNQTDLHHQPLSTEREPVDKTASNQTIASGPDASVGSFRFSTFESAISRMAMAKLADDSDTDSLISAFSKEKGSGGAFLPYSAASKSSASDKPSYIPDMLSPRKLQLNSPGRSQRKKEDERRKARTAPRSDVGVTDLWSTLYMSSSYDSKSVVSSTSGASALAERATKVLQKRRGSKATPSPKRQSEAKVEGPTFPFPASDNLVSRKPREAAPFDEDDPEAVVREGANELRRAPFSAESNSSNAATKKSKRSVINPEALLHDGVSESWRAPSSAESNSGETAMKHSKRSVIDPETLEHDGANDSLRPPSSTKSTPGKAAIRKSKRSAMDRSGFVNRYKSSERFIDSTGNDHSWGLTPRLVHDPPEPNFSYGSEVSTTSSVAAASSDDGSEPYINERTPSMKSDSTAGPMGIDQDFRTESSRNMYAMRTAYESVTAAELAQDLTEELTGTLAGSLEAMKNLATEFGKLTGGQKAACETQSYRKAYVRPTKQLDSIQSDEEEVAIEVEYIGDDEESSIDEGEDLYDKSPPMPYENEAPAGQSSAEVYI